MLKLQERNAEKIKKILHESEGVRKERADFKAKWGVDPYDKNMLEAGFQWEKAAKKMADFREAEMSTARVELLRAGVQNIANNMYQNYPKTWDKWVTVVASNKDTELYAPL